MLYPDPWFSLSARKSHAASAALGLGAALIVISATRLLVAHAGWARRLHADLRPIARDFSASQVLLVAGLSSLGEELLFRGLLAPIIGVVLSSLIFGLAHQIRTASRWAWVAWATIVGLMLGSIFAATGSLVGALLAHALINAANLSFLRDHDPEAATV